MRKTKRYKLLSELRQEGSAQAAVADLLHAELKDGAEAYWYKLVVYCTKDSRNEDRRSDVAEEVAYEKLRARYMLQGRL